MFRFLNKYKFVGGLDGNYNKSFFIRLNISRSLWVAKISHTLPPTANFKDLNQRALLAYKLSLLVDTPIPKTKILKLNQIEYSPDLIEFLDTIKSETIKDGILVTEFRGIPLSDFLKVHSVSDIVNFTEILENFVFNLWIGNYDKKNADYIIDQDNRVWSVDYNLLGPGFNTNKNLALGGYAKQFDINNVDHSGWCLGELLIEQLKTGKYPEELVMPIVERINNLPESRIISSFDGLTFNREASSEHINPDFIDFLLERRKVLKSKVSEWYAAGFPRKLPEDQPKVEEQLVNENIGEINEK